MENSDAVSLKDKIRESLVERRNNLCFKIINSHPEHVEALLHLEKDGPRQMMMLAPATADQVWNFFLENSLGALTPEQKEQYSQLRARFMRGEIGNELDDQILNSYITYNSRSYYQSIQTLRIEELEGAAIDLSSLTSEECVVKLLPTHQEQIHLSELAYERLHGAQDHIKKGPSYYRAKRADTIVDKLAEMASGDPNTSPFDQETQDRAVRSVFKDHVNYLMCGRKRKKFRAGDIIYGLDRSECSDSNGSGLKIAYFFAEVECRYIERVFDHKISLVCRERKKK